MREEKINKDMSLYVANILGIDFSKFTLDDFNRGMNIELEHGKQNPMTNVTNDDLIATAKIALSHLNEFPYYYNKDYGLQHFENFLKSKLNN